MPKRNDTRFRAVRDMSSGWTDSRRRFHVVDTLTNLPVDESTTAYAANSDAAQMNREWREAKSRARGVLLGALGASETFKGADVFPDTVDAVLDALTAAPEIVDALKEIR